MPVERHDQASDLLVGLGGAQAAGAILGRVIAFSQMASVFHGGAACLNSKPQVRVSLAIQ